MRRFALSARRRLRTTRSVAGLFAMAALVAACATTPLAPPVDEVPPPPPPPPPVAGEGPVLPDWRGLVTTGDRDRYQRRDAAWSLALEQAHRRAGSGDLSALGDLIQPNILLANAAPPAGAYRCRTVKLGSQGGEDSLGYVVYGWFACRIEQTPNGLKFVKSTGSQRPSGLLFPEDDRHMVMLGSMALGSEPAADSYGLRPHRDLIATLERIGPARWRLVIPWPLNESNLDLIELVPAR